MEYQLNNRWVLWYHKVDNDKWDLDSYERWMVINNLSDYYAMLNSIKDISAGMFFLMKEDITPLWEDPANKKGGYWSFRVAKSQSNSIWKDLSAVVIGDTLTVHPDQMEFINGISFSPKISNAIFRIWISDARNKDIKKVISNQITNLDTSEAIFKRY